MKSVTKVMEKRPKQDPAKVKRMRRGKETKHRDYKKAR
jgi:hypothetical protein